MVTQADKTNTAVVATIVVVGAFAMIAISALLTAMVRAEAAEVDAVRPTHADLETIAALDKQQTEALHAAPHWFDKEARRVSIPLENAEKLVIADLRADPKLASPAIPPGVVLPPVPPAEGTAGAPGSELAPGAAVAPPSVGSPVGGAAPAPAQGASDAPPTGAAPSAAPGPAAPGTPPIPPSRQL